MHYFINLIEHFGYFGIILALVGGIVGLPIPDEVLLTYVGYIIFQGKMAFIPSLLCAFAGACGGISISYFLGKKLGLPFLKKHGPKLHITGERLNKTRNLFTKLGPFLLFIGYFIPGVRHVTAYLSGINGFNVKKFALFAYTGAFTWCLTFISLGRGLGENWILVETYIVKYRIYFLFLLIIGIILVYAYWRKNRLVRNI